MGETGFRAELKAGAKWVDITGDVYTRSPVTYSRGRTSHGARTDPGQAKLTINNKDGRYSPRNAMSPYYGLIGRNSPIRGTVPGPTRLFLAEGAAGRARVDNTPALHITGDLDVRVDVTAQWTGRVTNGAWELAGRYDTAGQRSWALIVEEMGRVQLRWSTDGVALNFSVASAAVPVLPGRRLVVRATLDVDNGAGGWTVRYYTGPTVAGPWTLLGDPVTGVGVTSVHAGTAPLEVGDIATVGFAPVQRGFHALELRNGIDGSVVAAADFTAQTPGATSFVSGGLTWQVQGAASISDRHTRFVAEVSEWPQKWVPSGADVWTAVDAAGILRRLQQGAKPLDSTLRRRIPSGNPTAYWPMEEEREATRAYSPITGVQPAAVSGISFAAVDTLPSSRALPRLSAAATLSAIVPAHPATGQWQVELVYNADDKIPTEDAEILTVSTTGTVRRWEVLFRAGLATVFGYNASGAAIVAEGIGVGDDIFHGWVRLRLWARTSGTDTEWQISWQDVGGEAGAVRSTVAGTVGQVTAVTGTWGPLTNGWAIGHLSVLPVADSDLYDGSDDAFTGETAVQRMTRLATEESIPLGWAEGDAPSTRVGPQDTENLVTLFEAAAEADGGMLYEDRERPALAYRSRSTLYTQEPALTLAYLSPALAPTLEPVDDADSVRNDRTVTRSGGSSARAVLTEGPLSVQPPPNGVGTYDDSITLALADDTQPEPIAYWRLHLGTWDEARYPKVGVRLHQDSSLIPLILALDVGDVIRLTGLPAWVGPPTVDLLIEGYDETIEPFAWEITFACSPAGPWMTAVADHTVYGKADTDGSELAGAVTADATAIPVRVTAGPLWVTAQPVLNPNPDFETGLVGWSTFESAIDLVPTPRPAPVRGSWSMRITPNGTGQYPNAGSDQLPVVVGRQYVLSGWLRCAVSRNVALNVNWFAGDGSYLPPTSANDQFVQADTWTWFEMTVTAPTGAATANLSPTIPDFPPATDTLIVDRVTWRRASGMPREFPIDVTVGGEVMTVTAIEPRTLNANPELETSAAGWDPQNSTVERSTAQVPPGGAASLLITPNGTSAEGGATAALSGVGSVTPGREYTATMWVYSPGGWSNLQPCVDWISNVGGYVSTGSTAGFTVPAGQWTYLEQTFTAPDLASQASMRIRHAGTPPATAIYYAWGIRLLAVGEQTMHVQRATNGITKAHSAGAFFGLAHPAIASL